MKNKFGELTIVGADLDGNLKPGTHAYPTYNCGHCSKIVVMRPERARPRNLCLGCDSWICEESEICNTHCTPIHALARDHFEGAGERGKYIPAIMQGVNTVEEAHRLGLVTIKE